MYRRSLQATRCLSLLALCGLIWGLTPVAQAQPMADQLPAGTLVYAGWQPNAALKQTLPARMLADQRILQPWEQALGDWLKTTNLPQEIQAKGPVQSHLLPLVEDVLQCPGCFALLEIKQDAKTSALAPQMVFILDLAARRADFERHFQPIQEAIQFNFGDKVHPLKGFNPVKIEQSSLWGKTQGGVDECFWGYVGDRFVVYVGEGGEAFLRAMAAGKPAASLAAAPAFTLCLGKIPGDALLTSYVNVPPLLEVLHDRLRHNRDFNELTEDWPKILAEIGLDNLRSIGEKTAVEEGRFVTHTLLSTEGAPHGLLTMFLAGGVDDALLKCVAPDAMAVAALRLDLGQAYERLKAACIAAGGAGPEKNFSDFEEAAKAAGLPVQDALAPLGDQWVLYDAASNGASLSSLVLVGNVKDPAAFDRRAQIFAKLLAGPQAQAAGHVVREYQADGVTIHIGGDDLGRLQVSWAQSGDKVVVALFPQVVEDALRQLRAEKSLLDLPDFQTIRRQIGGDGPMLYINMPEIAKSIYPSELLQLNMLRALGSEDRNDAWIALVPSLQRLLGYLGGEGACARLRPDGIVLTQSIANPLLSALSACDSVPLWTTILAPALLGTR